MMDFSALVSDLVCMIIVLVTKPFILCISACFFCLRTAFIVIHMSMDLVNTAICFHVNMFWRTVTGTVSFLLLPLRFFTAIPRERLLEQCMREMQFELENLEWDRKEIEENLQAAIKEYRIMESDLAELEEEHDKAISKIERLEAELQDLKEENLRLKEIQGKGYPVIDDYGIPYGNIPTLKPNYEEVGIKFPEAMMKRDPWKDKRKTDAATSSPLYQFTNCIFPSGLEIAEVLGHRRGVALSQSVFSAVLSLVVGLIIFEAKEPCMPLVGALFTVVGISLKSVVQFFSTIKNKPASDAVALLSLNWFILGTLAYPTLPRVARMISPWLFRIMDPVFSWFGIPLH